MSDPKQSKEAAEKATRTDEPVDDKKEAGEKKALDYVFKISPADPKNNFDFEDVADK